MNRDDEALNALFEPAPTNVHRQYGVLSDDGRRLLGEHEERSAQVDGREVLHLRDYIAHYGCGGPGSEKPGGTCRACGAEICANCRAECPVCGRHTCKACISPGAGGMCAPCHDALWWQKLSAGVRTVIGRVVFGLLFEKRAER